ncbi:ABC transporter permease [Parabacteroides sp. OttesenSCG-928-N08]|nr:ABC transporter permease [Parabacteroides sp. OttesenSCG-928-N08]
MKTVKLALRSLRRYRMYSLINWVGLSLTLACVIIISRYLFSEYRTDHCFTYHERIAMTYSFPTDESSRPMLMTTDNILMRSNYTNALDMPEVEYYSSFVSMRDVTVEVGNRQLNSHLFATDKEFLQLFDYPLLIGDRATLLSEPNDAVITEAFARRVFGEEDPIGQAIDYNGSLLTVKGIIGETVTQTSFDFDLLVSKALQWRWPPDRYYSAALMVEGVDIRQVNAKLRSEYERPDNANKPIFLYALFPLDELYLDTSIERLFSGFHQGNKGSLRILSLVALMVLLIGIFNYIQIFTVILLRRRGEIGMKRVFGVRPMQLFAQLYVENFLQTLPALLIGWCLIELTQPLQQDILGIAPVGDGCFSLLLSLGLLFILPLITSISPAYRLTRQPTISAIQGGTTVKERSFTRSLLLVFQYAITCCLLIASLFFMKQLQYMLDRDPGFRTEDIIGVWFHRPTSAMYFEQEEIDRLNSERAYILQRIRSSALFEYAVSGKSPYELVADMHARREVGLPGSEKQSVYYVTITEEWLQLFDIPMKEQAMLGGGVSEVLLNETACRQLLRGKGDHATLVLDAYDEDSLLTVKGFTSDFQTMHLSFHDVPLVMHLKESDELKRDRILASIVPGRQAEAIEFLRKLHEEVIGGDFAYRFLADEAAAIYAKDRQVTLIYSLFALIAMIISSLGLFSLSLFDIQLRYREIAIRKVNGATTPVVMRLLLRNYLLLLGVAFLLSIPVSWLAINRYLEDFAHRTQLSWWIFAIALVVTAGVALLTLVGQIRRAAAMNPTEAINKQ